MKNCNRLSADQWANFYKLPHGRDGRKYKKLDKRFKRLSGKGLCNGDVESTRKRMEDIARPIGFKIKRILEVKIFNGNGNGKPASPHVAPMEYFSSVHPDDDYREAADISPQEIMQIRVDASEAAHWCLRAEKTADRVEEEVTYRTPHGNEEEDQEGAEESEFLWFGRDAIKHRMLDIAQDRYGD